MYKENLRQILNNDERNQKNLDNKEVASIAKTRPVFFQHEIHTR